jgi:hypothetical protein
MKLFIPKDMGVKAISEAVYQGTISKVELRTSKKGDPMISYEYTILSQGPDPEEKTIGRKVFDQSVLTDDVLWRHNIIVKAATGQEIPQLLEPEKEYSIDELFGAISNWVLNKNVILVIGKESYEGKENNKVKEVRPL